MSATADDAVGPRYIVGVDIGGTFTDAVVADGQGRVVLGKAPSTPPRFERGFLDALGAVAERMGTDVERLIAQTDGIYHGCTVGTNALVERKTARVGLLTTRGHRDSLFFMQAGGRLIGMPPDYVAHVADQSKDEPLVEKSMIAEVTERIAFDGATVVKLDHDECRESIRRLVDRGAEAFAVALLWSTADPSHERTVRELIEEIAPGAFVSLSSEISFRTGEYQRTVATAMNSLIGPVMDSYLGSLQEELRAVGYGRQLYVMSCSGGVIDAGYARALPLLTIGSGPVAGLIASAILAEAMETPNLITGDMGGTTFDVGVVQGLRPLARARSRHGQYEYFVPTLDVRSVGSGGGSIIHFDPETGSLRVGPQSAGADPGPAGYGRGGEEPTVTDAGLVLGYLNPANFLGGELEIDVERSRAALARVGAELGFDAEETAAAAARIVDNQMADAIRLASVQQGHDPRDFVMCAYGGAGAVHGGAVARELEMERMIIPLNDLASGWSAFGIAYSDAVVVEEAPLMLTDPFDPERLETAWRDIQGRAEKRFTDQGLDPTAVSWSRQADIRYSMQVNEVRIPVEPGTADEAAVARMIATFEAEYERLFGAGAGYPDAGFSLTALRIKGTATVGDADRALRKAPQDGQATQPRPRGERGVIWYHEGGRRMPTPVYDGADFDSGSAVDGPAIIEFVDTTLVVYPGQSVEVDRLGTFIVDVDGRA
jgi:N-methylhydantoinase A